MASRRKALRTTKNAMSQARSYAAWLAAAEELDRLTGLDAWRADDFSEHYDAAALRADLRTFGKLAEERRFTELADQLNESLHRNLNDVLDPSLHLTANAGTKHLVENWFDGVEDAIAAVVAADTPQWPQERRLGAVKAAARNLGRSALLLSGGATLGFYHMGVVRALWSVDLLPEVLVGASMGALVASGICSRTEDELDQLLNPEVPDIERVGLEWRRASDAWRDKSLMNPERMLATIKHNCGEYTFAEAFERSGRVLNISLMATRTRQKPRVLSHLTAPDVWIHQAALASAAVPGLFPPVALTRIGPDRSEKPYVAGEKWIDGSFGADLPTSRVSRLHNVNHFVVSQTQPHILPIMAAQEQGLLRFAGETMAATARAQGLSALAIARRIAGRGPLATGIELAHALVQQDFRGDIDIYPAFDPRAYLKIIKNPSREDLAWFTREGERATWPKVAFIRESTRIPRCLARHAKALAACDPEPGRG